MFQELSNKIEQLTTEADLRKSLDLAIETANELLRVLDPHVSNLRTGEDALDDAIPVNQFPNQKVENWFMNHPYFTGDKVALRFYSSNNVETKFYWLSDSATKARVSAGVMLTPNWEDSELTRNESYKIGIDFFLTANTKSLLVAISNNGNLRLLEFGNKLTHTQIEILQKLRGVLALPTKAQIHKTLWDALALSEVNKKFYAGIAEQFNILLNHLIADGRDKEDSKLFASRLLGRLLFIWFLRRKNIVQEQFGYFELEDNDSSTYYDSKLKKLFFQTLNKPVGERHGEDDKTPYLNGGLFEAHENDWPHQKVDFPTGFFNGLYEHLEKYNFTTDESSPEYEQVAIDPEMLGRVFESLLATQVTETGEQARKAKGTFYTPREIVSYMCKESLRQYLYAKLSNEAWNDGIDRLIDSSDSDWEIGHSNSKRNLWGESYLNTVPRLVIDALDELKILDPACGSGAFPMGMLQLVLKTYERLDPRFDPYKTKLQIIQNNIFGVDIEPMAVEISRLRAWLSLVVEDEENSNKVEPLPNLDFKFICANSLIPLEPLQQTAIFSDPTLHEKLSDLRIKFFNARKPEMKDKWRNEYYNLTRPGQQLLYADKRDSQLRSFDPFRNSQHAEFFDTDYMFGIQSFNIVIGNPPYVRQEKFTDIKPQLREAYSEIFNGRADLFTYFIAAGFNFLEEAGVFCFITSNKFFVRGYGKQIRKFLLEKTHLLVAVNFGELPVFQASVDSAIILSKKEIPREGYTIQYAQMKNASDINDVHAFFEQNKAGITNKSLGDEEWSFESPARVELLQKLKGMPSTLGKHFNNQIFAGIKTGLDDAFVINEKERNEIIERSPEAAKIIKPWLRGKDVRCWHASYKNLYIIYTAEDPVLARSDDALVEHLSKFRDKLEERATYQKWYEMQQPQTRFTELFDKPKMIYPDCAKEMRAMYDDTGAYGTMAMYFTPFDPVIMGILNSRLFDWYARMTFASFGDPWNGGRIIFKTLYMSRFPLPALQGDEATAIKSKVERALMTSDPELQRDIQKEIDPLVYKLYALTEDEIKLIESSNA